MTLLTHIFIKNSSDLTNPAVKKAYASLSGTVSVVLNLLLCAAKISIGLFSSSIAISADGFNNLSDAGTSFVSYLGFKIAKYGRGHTHPFGHGRIEWIVGIFTGIAVLMMGIRLAEASARSIVHPKATEFNAFVVIVLTLSILIKAYMYFYNRRFACITGSETLKAAAADCISDTISTAAVLISSLLSHLTPWQIDGFCGLLVSVFIIFTGTKSIWEVLGRIMGKSADQDTLNTILELTKQYPELVAVHDFMLHDYGFGYFVVTMRAEGYRKDSEQLYSITSEISYALYKKFHCDCFIQIGYLLEDNSVRHPCMEEITSVTQNYSTEISIDHFRIIENLPYINIMCEVVYPAELQKYEENICNEITERIEHMNPNYQVIINGTIRRDRFKLHK